jgi:transcriptional regulator
MRIQKEIELIMYMPKHFLPHQESRVRKLIEQNPFMTILSYSKDSMPFINHLPVIFSSKPNEDRILIGHMSKQNPQWRHFIDNPNATLIVQGPHTYITPKWYRFSRDVPTWNYAVAHLQGKVELVESFSEQVEVLKQLTHFFEKSNPSPWEFKLPDDLLDETALTSAIISFRFNIEKVDAKFKLSQNRGIEDKAGVIEGLKERTDDMSLAVREMMMIENVE